MKKVVREVMSRLHELTEGMDDEEYLDLLLELGMAAMEEHTKVLERIEL